MTAISFAVVGSGEVLNVAVRRVLIAGFTGRDLEQVRLHIQELDRAGVPSPEAVPVVFEVDSKLLTTANEIQVSGLNTSGEVEPVLVLNDGIRWLTVGSDHTDRDVERRSISESKGVCSKVIAASLVQIEADEDLDDVELTSWLDEDAEPYQHGAMSHLLPLSEIEQSVAEAGFDLMDGDVVFLGTIPVQGEGLRAGRAFRGRLTFPMSRGQLEVQYRVSVLHPEEKQHA